MTDFGLSKAAEVSFGGYLAARVFVAAAGFIGFSSILAIFFIPTSELKRVFLPIESAKNPDVSYSAKTSYIAAVCALPIVLVAAFLYAEGSAAYIVQSSEYSFAESLIRDKAGVVVAVIDDKYYDPEAVEQIYDDAVAKYDDLTRKSHEAIIDSINDTCNKQIANVDAYLDWYYSLTADYERLAQVFTGTIEDGMREQLANRINEGIDAGAIQSQLDELSSGVNDVEEDLKASLAECEIADIPDWLIIDKREMDLESLTTPPEPTSQLLGFKDRMLASFGAGTVGGVIAGKSTAKLLEKPVFKNISSKLATALARRGLLKTASAGVGSLIAPGVGTAGGIAVGVLTDYLFVKADEAMNREAYREEIIAAINESRDEMIAEVEAR